MRPPASISLDLREEASWLDDPGWTIRGDTNVVKLLHEAADCIDALATRADKAETALRELARWVVVGNLAVADRLARAALGEDPTP